MYRPRKVRYADDHPFFYDMDLLYAKTIKNSSLCFYESLAGKLETKSKVAKFPAASTAATSISHQWRNTSFITRQRTDSRAQSATCLCQAHAYWTYTSGKCMTIFFVPKTRGNPCSSAWWRTARTNFSPIKIEATILSACIVIRLSSMTL